MRYVGILLAAIAAAIAAPSAMAEKVHHTRADEARAQAAVLRRADLGTTLNWTKGTINSGSAPNPSCKNYNPSSADLTETGKAEASFKVPGLEFDSQASVLQTARMVQLDWQRSNNPALLSCLRTYIARSLPKAATIVSFTRVPFPHVTTYNAAFRLLCDVVNPQLGKVRVMVDLVLFGTDRTEMSLVTSTVVGDPARTAAAERALEPAELRLASIMIGRATTGTA